MKEKYNQWLVQWNNIDKPYRLYVFPYAGGNVSPFMKWQVYLHENIEIVGIQLPGRGAHYPAELIYDMQTILDTMQPIFQQATKPFAFFGHSMGALLAYKICQQLELKPHALVLSGCKGISLFNSDKTVSLTDEHIIERLRSYGGTPEDVLNDPELLSLFLPAIKADFNIVENYQWVPSPPENVPVLLLAGDEDIKHHRENALKWNEHTTIQTIYKEFPGGHFFINENAENIVLEINKFLTDIFNLSSKVQPI